MFNFNGKLNQIRKKIIKKSVLKKHVLLNFISHSSVKTQENKKFKTLKKTERDFEK